MQNTTFLTPAQKEDVRHGEYIFPIQEYHCLFDEAEPILTPHWHEEAELTLITEGSSIYHLNLQEYPVEAGDLLLVPPMILHSIQHTGDTPMRSLTYVFHLNFLGGNSADICSMKYFTPLMNQKFALPAIIKESHPAYPSLLGIFRQISSLYTERPLGYELALKSCFLQVIFLLLPYRQQEPSAPTPWFAASEKLKAVLNYIETNYDTAIPVSQLADICCFSEYHFMRFFKKHTGMTCVEYINNLRLEKAVQLFEQGHTSILEVSLSVGFGNLSYFHRAFKKKYGITPRTFLSQTDNGKEE